MADGTRSRTCAVDGCDRRAIARGWCSKHHQRWLNHGDPTFVKVAKPPRPHVELSVTYLRPGDPVPTTEPRRYTNVHGYVVLRWRVATATYVETLEHRVFDGAVTEAEHVHHVDRNRTNNDPANLVPVSPVEHSRHHRTTPRGEAVRLYESGMTTIQVAERLGTYPGNISRILRQEGVKARKGRAARAY